jgi:Killing trait
MSEEETVATPASNEPESQLNDQIKDAVAQLNAILAGSDQTMYQVAAYQMIAHAVTMTVQNAVAEQQHSHILRMALTTAASNAILDGRQDAAKEILALAESKLVTPNMGELLSQVEASIRTIGEELRKMRS